MKYALLIHSDEKAEEKMSPADLEALMSAYGRFTQELESSGAQLDSQRLRPTEAATTIRVRNGELLATDGPFAETKEQFGGFYLIEVDNIDQAIAWARKIPTAEYGSIEVRPVWDMEGEDC